VQLNAVSAQLQSYAPTRQPEQVQPKLKPETQTADKGTADKETPGAETFGEDQLLVYGRLAGQAVGGGLVAHRLGNDVAKHIREINKVLEGRPKDGMNAALPSFKRLAGAGMQGAGLAALISAGFSAVSNGVSIARGKTDSQQAMKNVMSDTIGGALGGFSAVSAAGAGTILLSSMGMAGLPLTIGNAIFGAAGSVLGSQLIRSFQPKEIESN